MKSTTEVGMGEIAISKSTGGILVTFVGSCVALCLFDPIRKIGGLAHVMLPEGKNHIKNSNLQGKYADVAIDTLLQNLVTEGAKKHSIKAKIVGGAQIFSNETGDNLFSIGSRNIESIKKILYTQGIPLISEETGNNYGRWVKFNIQTGEIVVKGKKKEEIII